MKHLTMAELTDLIWTAINGLGSTSPFRVQAAADMLLTAIQEHGAKLETVRAVGPPRRAHQDGAGGRGGGLSIGTQGLGPRGPGGIPKLGPEGETQTLPLMGSSE